MASLLALLAALLQPLCLCHPVRVNDHAHSGRGHELADHHHHGPERAGDDHGECRCAPANVAPPPTQSAVLAPTAPLCSFPAIHAVAETAPSRSLAAACLRARAPPVALRLRHCSLRL